jgi:hypothetical protein
LLVERAQAAVRESVREEVQVVEHDQGSERHRGIDRSADGHGQHALGTELPQRGDVRPVLDLAREPRMSLAVAGYVEHLRVARPPAADERLAEPRADRLRGPGLDAGKGVGAGARDDPDLHGRASFASAPVAGVTAARPPSARRTRPGASVRSAAASAYGRGT